MHILDDHTSIVNGSLIAALTHLGYESFAENGKTVQLGEEEVAGGHCELEREKDRHIAFASLDLAGGRGRDILRDTRIRDTLIKG